MSAHHLVVGAGPVGTHVARVLAERGEDVLVATRSGRDTGIAGVRHAALDATDADALTAAASGAAVLYNCANPGDYTQWARTWPPLMRALQAAAERSGAVYAITGNLYPYGPVDAPMREGMPDAATDHKALLRIRLWNDALEAHRAGRLRAVEVRSSDFVGTGVGRNGHITLPLPGALSGKTATMIGTRDTPHTFTDVLDTARTLVAAATDETAWGRVWHTPSNPALPQERALADVLAAAGKPMVRTRWIGHGVMRAMGLVVPFMREMAEMDYQWTAPYVMDDAETRAHFGMEPTPWDEVCRRTLVGVAPA